MILTRPEGMTRDDWLLVLAVATDDIRDRVRWQRRTTPTKAREIIASAIGVVQLVLAEQKEKPVGRAERT